MNKMFLNSAKTCFLMALLTINIACQKDNKETETTKTEDKKEASASTEQKDVKQPVSDTPTPEKGEEPVFQFAGTEHNFGEIKEGQVVKHTFKFKNVGKSPLVIKDATATCGCTVPKKPQNPIAPGGEGEIEVEFNSQGKSGVQEKDITVTANTIPAQAVLKIKGSVNSIATMQGPLQKK